MLAEHFGEHLEAACGNCSFCRGEGGWAIPPIPRRDIGDAARHVLDEVTADYPDHLTTARHRAMFLCGLKSPRMARSRLCRHPSFGICAQIPFAQVLEQVERR
jgi:ATP-dependent DNA helicase RecQ